MLKQISRLSKLEKASKSVLQSLAAFLLVPNWQLLSEDDWLLRLTEYDPEFTAYLYDYESRLLEEPWLLGKPWLS